jgi:hypothetical protein
MRDRCLTSANHAGVYTSVASDAAQVADPDRPEQRLHGLTPAIGRPEKALPDLQAVHGAGTPRTQAGRLTARKLSPPSTQMPQQPAREDGNGSGTLSGVAPGNDYPMVASRYNNQWPVWGQAVQLKPDADSVRLDQSKAVPINWKNPPTRSMPAGLE